MELLSDLFVTWAWRSLYILPHGTEATGDRPTKSRHIVKLWPECRNL